MTSLRREAEALVDSWHDNPATRIPVTRNSFVDFLVAAFKAQRQQEVEAVKAKFMTDIEMDDFLVWLTQRAKELQP